MPAVAAPAPMNVRTGWLDLALPKEHGSWSLALEPLAFGLLAAPSIGGAWLALAVVGAFFARRPLRLAWSDPAPERRAAARTVLAGCAGFSFAALAATVIAGGFIWSVWLLPAAVGGGLFVMLDLRGEGRSALAEIAGTAAFAAVPAALGILAGRPPAEAAALALVMGGRAVPTVMTVRAALRGAKTGVSTAGPALLAAGVAVALAAVLAVRGTLSWFPVAALAVLGVRTAGLLVWPRPILRARTVGMIEGGLGLAFVAAVGLALRSGS